MCDYIMVLYWWLVEYLFLINWKLNLDVYVELLIRLFRTFTKDSNGEPYVGK